MNNYYNQKFFIPKVNEEDIIIGKIDRWEAHKKAILHRGFTAILKNKDNLILQLRKHIVFDRRWDLSFSSHPLIIDDNQQTFEEAIKTSYKREWITNDFNLKINFLDKYQYKEFDEESKFFEHEINYLYLVEIDQIPKNNLEFSYDMQVIKINDLPKKLNQLDFAPWVKKINFKKIMNFLL